MSTAEQVIAKHIVTAWWHCDEHGQDEYACICGHEFSREGWAAHVVAALQDAGMEIVDRAGIAVEYGVERDAKSGRKTAVAYDRSIAERAAAEWTNNARVVQRRVWTGEWEPAAARVAEGGEV